MNNGVLDPILLQFVAGSTFHDTYNGEPITYSQRFFDRYPGHSPVFCLQYRGLTKCVLQIGDFYVLPVMRHYGIGDEPIPCDWYVDVINHLFIKLNYYYFLII